MNKQRNILFLLITTVVLFASTLAYQSDFVTSKLQGNVNILKKITFEEVVDGEQLSYSSSKHQYNSTITIGDMADKPGYKFEGWTTNVDNKTYNNGDTFKVKKETVFTTIYTKVNKLDYLDVDSNVISTINMTKNEKTIVIKAPEHANPLEYKSIGWKDMRTYDKYVEGETYTMYNNDERLIAIYDKKFTVTYDENGGGLVPEPTVGFNGMTLSTETPSREGHTFKHWATASSGSTKKYMPGDVVYSQQPITLYAQWEINSYTLSFGRENNVGLQGVPINASESGTFDGRRNVIELRNKFSIGNNGAYKNYNIPQDAFVIMKLDFDLEEPLSENNMILINHSRESNGSGPNEQAYVPLNELESMGLTQGTLYFAIFVPDENSRGPWLHLSDSGVKGTVSNIRYELGEHHTLASEDNSPVAVFSDKVEYDTHLYTWLRDPVVESNQAFIGWFDKPQGELGAVEIEKMPGRDITVYPHIVNKKSIKYNLNGGTGSLGESFDMPGAIATINATAPSRPDYEFAGWTTALNGTGESYMPGDEITMNEDVTLYAQWTQSHFNLYFNRPVDEAGAVITEMAQGVNIVGAENVTAKANGYVIMGSPDGININSSTVFIPKARLAKNGGMFFSDYGFKSGDSIVIQMSLKDTSGKNFVYTKSNYIELVLFEENPTSTVAKQQRYAPTNLDDLIAGKTNLLKYNVTLNDDTVQYAPAGFTTSSSFTIKGDSIYSDFRIELGNYITDGDDSTSEITFKQKIQKGTLLTDIMMTPPSTSTHVFIGWFDKPVGAPNPIEVTEMPEKDTHIFPYYESRSSLSFDMAGGTPDRDVIFAKVGSQFRISTAVPTKKGFTFIGWNTNTIGTGTSHAPGGLFTMTKNPIVLYAQWNPAIYKVTFNSAGGNQSFTALSGSYGTSVTIPYNYEPTRNDNVPFFSWNTRADGTGTDYDLGQKVPLNDNITLYAVYKRNNMAINYYSDRYAQNLIHTQLITPESCVVLSNPNSNGYTSWSVVNNQNLSILIGDTMCNDVGTVNKFGTYSIAVYPEY